LRGVGAIQKQGGDGKIQIMSRVTKVGLDFDGVVAYNPFRVIRAPITGFKRKILKKRGLKFFIPHNRWQQFLWRVLHESSIVPAPGLQLLREMVKERKIEAHLVTARFNFLNQNLERWLGKFRVRDLFTTVSVNNKNQQPHLFKQEIIKKYKFDYYIEDNLDVVEYLEKNNRVKICWIYNLVDKFLYRNRAGFGYLKKALQWIQDQEK